MKHLRHLSYVILLFINILALSSFVYASEETSSYESETSSPPNLSSIEISIDTSAESETSLAEIKATIPKTYISCIEEQTKGIKISWKKKNVTGYKIYRSTQSNRGFKRVKTISKNTITSWTDKKAKASTTYYYKIKCYIKKELSESSNAVEFETSNTELKLDFSKNLGKFIKKNIYHKYACNVLVKKYIESCSTLQSGKKATSSGQFTNIKVKDYPVADQWKSGNVKITLKISKKKCTYTSSGNAKKTTYPLKKTSLKLNDVKSETNMEKLVPGDIIAYAGNNGYAHHVAIYIGKFDTKKELVDYLNSDAVGLKCSGNESWLKSWNGNCKYWVIQGGMGNSGKDVYICNNADRTTTNIYSNDFYTLRKRLTVFANLSS